MLIGFRPVPGSTTVYKMIEDHCESSMFHTHLRLQDDFRSKHALLCLHVWMILRRLRKEGDDAKRFSQNLYEHFQRDVEMRIHREGVRVRVSKWLRELEDIFFGATLGYDNAIDKQSEDLSEALHRNVYGKEGDIMFAKALSRYVTRELASLRLTDTKAILEGQIGFNLGPDE